MSEILSKGNFTVKRLINGHNLMFALNVQGSLTQVYDPKSKKYFPDFTSNNLIITPALSGISGATFAKPTWIIKDYAGNVITQNGTSGTYVTTTVGTGAPYALTLKSNILQSQKTFTIICSTTYTDPNTSQITDLVAQATVSRIDSPGNTLVGWIETPGGNLFHNCKQTDTLTAVMKMEAGGSEDTSGNTFQWYRADGSTWTALTSSTAKGETGYNTQTLTVPASAIKNVQSYRCIETDNDTSSGTDSAGGKLVAVACVTFVDNSDPWLIKVQLDCDALGDAKTSTTVRITIWKGNGDGNITDSNGQLTDATELAKYAIKAYRITDGGLVDTTWGDVSSTDSSKKTGYKALALNATTAEYTTDITINDLFIGTQTGFGVQMEG